jgi:hypothetical protein
MHVFKKLAKICKNICIQTNEILFNDSYRFLKFHMIGESKKTCFFIICTSLFMSNWTSDFDRSEIKTEDKNTFFVVFKK